MNTPEQINETAKAFGNRRRGDMTTGCSIATPTIVYAWPDKEGFDQLAVEERVHEWKMCRTTTVLRGDGHEWERRCHSKVVDGSGIMVIFQWFDERPVTHSFAGTDRGHALCRALKEESQG